MNDGRMTHGKADLGGEVQAVAQVVDERGARHVEADLVHGVFEQETVFGLLDGVQLGADQLDAVLVEDAGVGHVDREVEGGLAADCGQDGEDAWLAGRLQHVDSTRRISSTYFAVSGSM